MIQKTSMPSSYKQGTRLRSHGGAVATAIAIYELAAKAVKYGRRVTITRQISTGSASVEASASDDSIRLILERIESDGPSVLAPTRRGFAATLIERGVVHGLSGEVVLRSNATCVPAILSAAASAVDALQIELNPKS